MKSNERGYRDIGYAKVDLNRLHRKGFPEVIYCPGKTKEHIKKISKEILDAGQLLVLTRINKNFYTYLKKVYPKLKFNPQGKIAYLVKKARIFKKGYVLIVTAGTADIPVAEEAAVIAQLLGSPIKKLYDVGVAGIHRLLDKKQLLQEANVIIVVAGMEGALPSIVGGLVSCPVIAVPTSIGYGASFSGLSALLTMLNSCSPGVSVVNIDNGFGAGYFANLINR